MGGVRTLHWDHLLPVGGGSEVVRSWSLKDSFWAAGDQDKNCGEKTKKIIRRKEGDTGVKEHPELSLKVRRMICGIATRIE